MFVRPDQCRGFILRSSGTKLCLRQECDIASHHSDRFEGAQEGSIHVKVPKQSQAFVEPWIVPDRLPTGYNLSNLETMLRPAPVLRALLLAQGGHDKPAATISVNLNEEFARSSDASSTGTPLSRRGTTMHPSVRSFGGGRSQDLDSAMAQALKEVQTPARLERTFKIPAKANPMGSLDQGMLSLDSLEELLAAMSERDDISVEDPQAQVALLRRMLEELNIVIEAAMEAGKAHNDLHAKTHNAVDIIDERFLKVHRMINLLQTTIGETPKAFDSATVWDSIEEVNEGCITQAKLDSALAAMESTVARRLEETKALVSHEASHGVTSLEREVQDVVEKIGQEFIALATSVKDLGEEVRKSQANQGGSLGTSFRAFRQGNIAPVAGHKDSTDLKLENRIAALETKLINLASSGRTTETVHSDFSMSNLEAALFQKLDEQNSKIRMLERKIAGDGVFRSSSGDVYGSFEDVLAMVQRNPSCTRIGVFLDMVSLFVVMEKPAVSGHEHATMLLSSSKIHRNAADSEALASLTHERPVALFGATTDIKSAKVVSRTEGFGVRLKKFEHFDENLRGQKGIIKNQLMDTRITLTSGLDQSEEYDRLAFEVLFKALEQCNAVLDFMTNMYRSLTTTCRYAEEPAWRLVGRCTSVIFVALASVRAKAKGLEDISTDRARATYIWTIMQSITMMQEVIDKGFQSHPVVMKEVMEFQLENRVDAAQIEAVQAEMKQVKTQVKEMQTALTKFDKTGSGSSEKITKMNQELGNLRTEVKKIQAKIG